VNCCKVAVCSAVTTILLLFFFASTFTAPIIYSPICFPVAFWSVWGARASMAALFHCFMARCQVTPQQCHIQKHIIMEAFCGRLVEAWNHVSCQETVSSFFMCAGYPPCLRPACGVRAGEC
jgi:hypothetical protein